MTIFLKVLMVKDIEWKLAELEYKLAHGYWIFLLICIAGFAILESINRKGEKKKKKSKKVKRHTTKKNKDFDFKTALWHLENENFHSEKTYLEKLLKKSK